MDQYLTHTIIDSVDVQSKKLAFDLREVHNYGLDMVIQVLDSRRSRSRACLTGSNLGYYNKEILYYAFGGLYARFTVGETGRCTYNPLN